MLQPFVMFDIIDKAMDELVCLDMQFVIVGTGDERYEEMFPNAEYGKDCFYAGTAYTYIGYFTKPMLREVDNASDAYIPYTFMPEIGNNECWFKNLRK